MKFLIFDVAPEAATLWLDISNLFLIVGAVVIAFATYGSIKFAGIRDEYSEQRTSKNEAETKRAIADSDIAKEGTSKANERIAELSTQAEQLRKDTADANLSAETARLELEKFRAPRILGIDKSDAIAKSLLKFAGTRFDASVVSGDPEAINFLGEIAGTLEIANWTWVAWGEGGPFQMVYRFEGSNKPAIGALGHLGITVMIHPDDVSALDAAATALANSLAAAGFGTPKLTAKNENASTKNAVHLLVGRKP